MLEDKERADKKCFAKQVVLVEFIYLIDVAWIQQNIKTTSNLWGRPRQYGIESIITHYH